MTTTTRTADEIYEDIRALSQPAPYADGAGVSEQLAYAEALLAVYRRQRDLWDELGLALMGDPAAPSWGFAAALGAWADTLERVSQVEQRVERLRRLLPAEAGTRV